MRIDIGCRFEFDVARPTHGAMIVETHPDEDERVHGQQFVVQPDVPTHQYLDAFGTRCRRITLPAGTVTLTYSAVVDDDGEIDPIDKDAPQLDTADLPDETLVFLLPSRYCESDRLGDVAFREFGHIAGGWQRAQAISQWVHDRTTFDYGLASPYFTARNVLESHTGVCRDFTHLGVALCRALNIPARYVFGYLPDIGVPDPGMPMDFCAWLEVYVGDGWYTFDPRNHQHRIGRVVVGRGRDAADVAMLTTFGHVQLREMTVIAEEATA